MKMRLAAVILTLLVAACTSAPPQASTDRPSVARAWQDALNGCEPDVLASLYAPEALFWPTTSRTLATKPADVRAYYDAACKGLKAGNAKTSIDSESVMAYGDVTISAGTATINLTSGGAPVTLGVRYSFTARKAGNKWLIIEHHSSLMPAPPR